jgi:hypothetical protein
MLGLYTLCMPYAAVLCLMPVLYWLVAQLQLLVPLKHSCSQQMLLVCVAFTCKFPLMLYSADATLRVNAAVNPYGSAVAPENSH